MFNSNPIAATQGALHAEPAIQPSSPEVLEVESLRLLQGRREVLIRHGNDCYRLRHTRNDKLILTK